MDSALKEVDKCSQQGEVIYMKELGGKIESFRKVPSTILKDAELSLTDKLVYIVLLKCVYSKDSTAYVARDHISKLANISVGKVSKSLKALKLLGYISIRYRYCSLNKITLNKEKGSFVKFPSFIYKKELKSISLVVLANLIDIANKDNYSIYGSLQEISIKIGLDVRTLKKYLQDLELENLVTINSWGLQLKLEEGKGF